MSLVLDATDFSVSFHFLIYGCYAELNTCSPGLHAFDTFQCNDDISTS